MSWSPQGAAPHEGLSTGLLLVGRADIQGQQGLGGLARWTLSDWAHVPPLRLCLRHCGRSTRLPTVWFQRSR